MEQRILQHIWTFFKGKREKEWEREEKRERERERGRERRKETEREKEREMRGTIMCGYDYCVQFTESRLCAPSRTLAFSKPQKI